MDLEELRAFLGVVESGSFLSAADSLHVSRTTLRRRVESLEARAGVPLLESTRQGVVLTDAGQTLARRGRLMVQEASALLTSIREIGQEPSGVLRIALPAGFPPHVIALLFGSLRATYPRLRIHCRVSDDPLGEPLADLDMAVHFGEAKPRGPWLSVVVLRLRQWLLASRAYLDRRGTPRSIDELAAHELLAWQAPGEDARAWPLRKGGTVNVEPVLAATDIHMLRLCCVAGQGIGLLPDALLPQPLSPDDELVPVLEDVVGRELAIRVTVPEALAEIPKIKMVLERARGFLDGR